MCNRHNFFWFVVLAVLTSLVLVKSPRAADETKPAPAEPVSGPPANVQKWDYSWSQADLTSMKERGKEGWEVVAITVSGDIARKEVWYKRPLVEPKKSAK